MDDSEKNGRKTVRWNCLNWRKKNVIFTLNVVNVKKDMKNQKNMSTNFCQNSHILVDSIEKNRKKSLVNIA